MAAKKAPQFIVKGNIYGGCARTGLSQRDLVKIVSMSQSTLADRYSTEDNFTLGELKRLAFAVGYSDYRQILLDPTKNERITTA